MTVLHGLFFFPKEPVCDAYDMGMGVGYLSDTHTQFRNMDILTFMLFEEKESHIS